jgi:hypothetical protein
MGVFQECESMELPVALESASGRRIQSLIDDGKTPNFLVLASGNLDSNLSSPEGES